MELETVLRLKEGTTLTVEEARLNTRGEVTFLCMTFEGHSVRQHYFVGKEAHASSDRKHLYGTISGGSDFGILMAGMAIAGIPKASLDIGDIPVLEGIGGRWGHVAVDRPRGEGSMVLVHHNHREMRLTLAFDSLPVGINLNDRSHWAVRKKTVDTAHALVREKLAPPVPRIGPVVIHIHFYLGDRRRRDLDNLMGACKPYIDGLVLAGLLRDDGMECVPRICGSWEYRKGKPGFDMRLEDMRLEEE